MSEYIYARIDKNEVLSELLKSNSIFSELYNMPYPKEDTACDDLVTFLNEHFGKDIKSKTNYTLTYLEVKAIVNWIYRAYSNATKRKEETVNLLSDLDENYSVGKLEFIHDILHRFYRTTPAIVHIADQKIRIVYHKLIGLDNLRITMGAFRYISHNDRVIVLNHLDCFL